MAVSWISGLFPGPPGATGPAGAAGTNGVNAFSTTQSFVAPNRGEEQFVDVGNASWIVFGQYVVISDNTNTGTYRVTDPAFGPTTIVVRNDEDIAFQNPTSAVTFSAGTIAPSGRPVPSTYLDDDGSVHGAGSFTAVNFTAHQVDLSGADVEVDLPVGAAGAIIEIDQVVAGTANVIFDPNGADTIEGLASWQKAGVAAITSTVAGISITVRFNGTTWKVIRA